MPVIFTHPEAVQKQLKDENAALRQALQQKQSDVPQEGAHLVVNGQVRKIGKKSQYLLDMLTLPED